ncbi:unnamed protein product [Calypogeia fissa]
MWWNREAAGRLLWTGCSGYGEKSGIGWEELWRRRGTDGGARREGLIANGWRDGDYGWFWAEVSFDGFPGSGEEMGGGETAMIRGVLQRDEELGNGEPVIGVVAGDYSWAARLM